MIGLRLGVENGSHGLPSRRLLLSRPLWQLDVVSERRSQERADASCATPRTQRGRRALIALEGAGGTGVPSRCAGPVVESQARGTQRCLASPRSRRRATVPHPPSSRAALSRSANRARLAGHDPRFAAAARPRAHRAASRRRPRSQLQLIGRRRQHIRTGPRPRRCFRRVSTPTTRHVGDRQPASSGQAVFRSFSLSARKTADSATVARASTPPPRMSHGQ